MWKPNWTWLDVGRALGKSRERNLKKAQRVWFIIAIRQNHRAVRQLLIKCLSHLGIFMTLLLLLTNECSTKPSEVNIAPHAPLSPQSYNLYPSHLGTTCFSLGSIWMAKTHDFWQSQPSSIRHGLMEVNISRAHNPYAFSRKENNFTLLNFFLNFFTFITLVNKKLLRF
jgi:hypothetical protein